MKIDRSKLQRLNSLADSTGVTTDSLVTMTYASTNAMEHLCDLLNRDEFGYEEIEEIVKSFMNGLPDEEDKETVDKDVVDALKFELESTQNQLKNTKIDLHSAIEKMLAQSNRIAMYEHIGNANARLFVDIESLLKSSKVRTNLTDKIYAAMLDHSDRISRLMPKKNP